jgi:nucleoid DNA-binding protein
MKLNELSEIVSKQAKVEETAVRRTLKVTIALLKEQIEKEDRVLIPGLGSFIRKEGKEPGQSRIIFKPIKEKEAEEV